MQRIVHIRPPRAAGARTRPSSLLLQVSASAHTDIPDTVPTIRRSPRPTHVSINSTISIPPAHLPRTYPPAPPPPPPAPARCASAPSWPPAHCPAAPPPPATTACQRTAETTTAAPAARGCPLRLLRLLRSPQLRCRAHGCRACCCCRRRYCRSRRPTSPRAYAGAAPAPPACAVGQSGSAVRLRCCTEHLKQAGGGAQERTGVEACASAPGR
mgnify:CR=1 FL=1